MCRPFSSISLTSHVSLQQPRSSLDRHRLLKMMTMLTQDDQDDGDDHGDHGDHHHDFNCRDPTVKVIAMS